MKFAAALSGVGNGSMEGLDNWITVKTFKAAIKRLKI
jgi:hypothetical protein